MHIYVVYLEYDFQVLDCTIMIESHHGSTKLIVRLLNGGYPECLGITWYYSTREEYPSNKMEAVIHSLTGTMLITSLKATTDN